MICSLVCPQIMLYRVVVTSLHLLAVVLCRFVLTSHTPIGELCVLLLCVTPCTTENPGAAPTNVPEAAAVHEDYEYYQDGDVIIGGVFTVNSLLRGAYYESLAISKMFTVMWCLNPQPHFYKDLLTFFFAIDEINKNPTMLPNITLGYHLYDSCAETRKAIKNTLQILSGPGKMVPNFSCRERKKILGFIGDQSSATTTSIAQILGLYRYVQISYGATCPTLKDKSVFPTLFRMVRNDFVIYSNLAQMLKHFGWNWIGIISSTDDSGREEFMVLRRVMRGFIDDKTIILDPTWATNIPLLGKHPEIFNCSLSFGAKSTNIEEFQNFANEFQPHKKPKDKLLEDLWMSEFGCSSVDKRKNRHFENLFKRSLHECNGTEHITDIQHLFHGGNAHQVYHAVYSMATALHDMLGFMKTQTSGSQLFSFKHQKLHRYIEASYYFSENTSHKYFNEDREFVTQYVIQNHLLVNKTILTNDVGLFEQSNSSDQNIFINASLIKWKNEQKEIPRSQCSEDCLPGNREVPSSNVHECCHDCVPCSEGEMSNETGSENCMTCLDHEWPNKNKTECNPKQIEFLSYTESLSLFFMVISLFLCIITFLIMTVFISYGDTPIVRANNKSLSFVLLVSIMLGFLCVFLFLGRPLDTTCRLRQTSFGFLFTIAVSSVLGKTVMVWLAFKATKPGSVWKKWVGVKLPNFVVFICSSIQVLICIAWLSASPPFQELDKRSYQTKIIVQCNEGSVVGFYSVLGYMGILAAVSFVTAFLARTLPDSFNEAKYITFSMLVFCSVWIAMIPAYLSTKGKYMVAVEIFAILTSNAGLLGCIFFPKCYIMICHPDLNSRKLLLDNRKMP
ncbi:vomeronasal type-2 receptor 26-like [Rana temporaria]|uniref:vomeronasal type-2 receptor 26-like n=1 Tax=Rana temporaria TaxID=8407 RepID=UPI001AAD39E9|nr:vomeronasal type-2 receptor 26-like [Rana temporaria]